MKHTNHQTTLTHNAQVLSQLIHAQVVDLIDKSPNSPNSLKANRKEHRFEVTPAGGKRSKKPQGVHLQLLGNGSPDKFIGVHAVPGRLPELLHPPSRVPLEQSCLRVIRTAPTR